MELCLGVEDLPCLSPDSHRLIGLPGQWVSECSRDLETEVCRLSFVLFLMVLGLEALVLLLKIPLEVLSSIGVEVAAGLPDVNCFACHGYLQTQISTIPFNYF